MLSFLTYKMVSTATSKQALATICELCVKCQAQCWGPVCTTHHQALLLPFHRWKNEDTEKFTNLLKVTQLVTGPGFEFRPPLTTISSVTILLNVGTCKTLINGPMITLLNRTRLKQCLFIDQPPVWFTCLLRPLFKNPWIPHHTTYTSMKRPQLRYKIHSLSGTCTN